MSDNTLRDKIKQTIVDVDERNAFPAGSDDLADALLPLFDAERVAGVSDGGGMDAAVEAGVKAGKGWFGPAAVRRILTAALPFIEHDAEEVFDESMKATHDALNKALAEVERLREAVRREHGEPIDEVYTVDGLEIVMGQIHQLRAERDKARRQGVTRFWIDRCAEAAAERDAAIADRKALVDRVRQLADKAIHDGERHKKLKTIAQDHRPCETLARSQFAKGLRALLDGETP